MNSNKYDFYKNSIYYLIANAVVLLAGIVVASVWGFNYQSSIAGAHVLFQSVLSVVISLVLVLLYVGLRYDFAKAFSVVGLIAHNVLLSTALIAIIRIPITENIVASYLLLTGFSTVYTLLTTEKFKNVDLKKANYSELIKETIKENVKRLTILSATIVVVLLLSMIMLNQNIFSVARLFFVMMVVLLYSMFTLALPAWCFFSSKIKKIKKAKVDENVENQKVAKAVAIEEKSSEIE